MRQKIEFIGSSGDKLAGLLETPDAPAAAYALFAHCFTCGKDIAAASRVSRALLKHGYAVLRFDFTGLGNSDGDFANTNFSSNVDDLIAASTFLRENYDAPSLLIGHSLGGTAVLKAANDIPECKGVVTIGSPADAQHVAQQFACDISAINENGEAEVDLAGRKFLIKKQFIDDINNTNTDHIASLKKALLVMHSPIDSTVSAKEAERIFVAAKHPKSFISLDNADHLLSRARDAEYVADTIAAWASRFIPSERPKKVKTKSGEVYISEKDHAFMLDVYSDSHQWTADEPTRVGGKNAGPDPYEHLLAAVGTCTAMTVRMYAGRKEWPLDDVRVHVSHTREHLKDCENCDEKPQQLDVISRRLEFIGNLSDQQRTRLAEIADKCPVHKTLTGHLDIRSDIVDITA